MVILRVSIMEQSTKVYNYIIEHISSGLWKPSEKIPTEMALAKTLEVSRSSVREAQTKLVALGVISKTQGKGAFVEPENPTTSLLSMFPKNQFNFLKEDLHDLYEFRLIVDPASAQIFAERATEEEILELRSIYDKLVASFAKKDGNTFIQCDSEFHIYLMKKNKFMESLNEVLSFTKNREFLYEWGKEPAKGIEEKKNILEAVEARDGELAALYARRHVLRVLQKYK